MAGVCRSRSVRGEAVDLHARWCPARGPAVVCVHGAGISSRYRIPTLCELGGEFEVWAPDLPGFGATQDRNWPGSVALVSPGVGWSAQETQAVGDDEQEDEDEFEEDHWDVRQSVGERSRRLYKSLAHLGARS